MRPLVPLAISFIFGIVFSRSFRPTYGFVIIVLSLSVILLFVSALRRQRVYLWFVAPAMFSLGTLFMMPLIHLKLPQMHIRNFVGREPLRIEGIVYGMSERKGPKVSVYVEARGVWMEGGLKDAVGKILLDVEDESRSFFFKRGDTVRFIAKLKPIRDFGNPGEFDYRFWHETRGIFVKGYVKDGLIVKTRDGGGFLSLLDETRAEIGRFIDSSGVRNNGIIKALIIGERGEIPHSLNDAFVRTGTVHLLSISGLHVGFVAWFSYFVFLRLFKRSERLALRFNLKRLSTFISIFPVVFYGMTSGFSLPTQRAVVMIGAIIFAVFTGRIREFYNAVALAALLILVFSPGSLWEPSFQLTFTAVISIAYLTPGFSSLFEGAKDADSFFVRHIKDKAKALFFATIAASLGTAPLLAYHYNMFSFSSFIANLFAVPLAGVVVLAGLMAVLVMPLWNGFASLLFAFSDVVLSAVVFIVEFFSKLPYSSVWVRTPTFLDVLIFYVLLFCLPFITERRFLVAALSVGSLFLIERGYLYYKDNVSNDLVLTFISVGHGDSTLIEFPSDGFNRKRMLIDGGGFYGEFDTGRNIVAPVILNKRIRKIDYIVLSHPQIDHMEGLGYIVENFSPDEFWWNGRGELDHGLSRMLWERGVKIRVVGGLHPEEMIDKVKVEFLHPHGEFHLDVNNMSLVHRISYGARSFLFTGDIGEKAETMLAKKDIRADVLKIPHHGSRSSSTGQFIDKVRPKIGVFSVGFFNPMGLPNPETIERYKARGVELYRTDAHGAIEVSTDGMDLRIKTQLTGDYP